MKKIIVSAEAFGYGPIVTCLNVLERLKNKLPCYYIFIGTSLALEKAKDSNIFDQYIHCEIHDMTALLSLEHTIKDSDMIISFENPQTAIMGNDLGIPTYYVDNLFWMWDSIPEKLYNIDRYFVVDVFNTDENINRIGKPIKNLSVVGALRPIVRGCKNTNYTEDRIIVNLGGVESFLVDSSLSSRFYYNIVKMIYEVVDELFTEEKTLYVCGGANIISKLHKLFSTPNIHFKSFEHHECVSMMRTSKYIIISPGLGNFFETLTMDQEVCILPPINYSQFWQIEEYRKHNMGYHTHNWIDYDWYAEVERYVDEHKGVAQVKTNIERFLDFDDNKQKFKNYLIKYFNEYKSDWFDSSRNNFINNHVKCGLDEICNSLIYEMKNIETKVMA